MIVLITIYINKIIEIRLRRVFLSKPDIFGRYNFGNRVVEGRECVKKPLDVPLVFCLKVVKSIVNDSRPGATHFFMYGDLKKVYSLKSRRRA